jgi:hypothetical protein
VRASYCVQETGTASDVGQTLPHIQKPLCHRRIVHLVLICFETPSPRPLAHFAEREYTVKVATRNMG